MVWEMSFRFDSEARSMFSLCIPLQMYRVIAMNVSYSFTQLNFMHGDRPFNFHGIYPKT